MTAACRGFCPGLIKSLRASIIAPSLLCDGSSRLPCLSISRAPRSVLAWHTAVSDTWAIIKGTGAADESRRFTHCKRRLSSVLALLRLTSVDAVPWRLLLILFFQDLHSTLRKSRTSTIARTVRTLATQISTPEVVILHHTPSPVARLRRATTSVAQVRALASTTRALQAPVTLPLTT